jgi:hypothetical protein
MSHPGCSCCILGGETGISVFPDKWIQPYSLLVRVFLEDHYRAMDSAVFIEFVIAAIPYNYEVTLRGIRYVKESNNSEYRVSFSFAPDLGMGGRWSLSFKTLEPIRA